MSGDRNRAWVIGASRGLGRELARLLAGEQWQLHLSARDPEALADIATECGATGLPLDATDAEAMRAAADHLYSSGPLQLVVLNVGDYRPMPLAGFDRSLFEHLNRVNYLSGVYLLDALLPHLRRHGGEVVLNVSASAYCGLPQAAPYSAPKAAMLNMAESLQPELQAIGVRLRVINHGFVESRLSARNRFRMPFLMTAERAAQRILTGLKRDSFEIEFPRRLTWALKLMRALPYPARFAIARRMVS